MIPVKLSIQGLYSYQEKQEIDFTKLTQAQLFGIFGSTGSGKSSILEAMMFALYGKSERLNIKERNYNMMNLKSNRVFIELDFVTGKIDSGEMYRFVVESVRNKKKFEKIDKFERKAYKLEEGEWIPIEADSTEKIIGLSYENFKRTIIIPQGQFQEFLQLGAKDRTQMLKEIFHLEKYDLADKASILEQRNKQKVAELEAVLNTLVGVSVETIMLKRTQLDEKNHFLKQEQKVLVEKKKLFTRLEGLQKIFLQIEELDKKATKLRSQKPDIEQKEAKLKQYEMCIQTFRQDFEQRAKWTEKQEEVKKNLELKQRNLQKSQKDAETSEMVFKQVETQYLNRESLNARREELQAAIELKKNELALLERKSNLAKGLEMTEKKRLEIKEVQQKIATTEQNIAELKNALPDFSVLLAVRDWFGTHENLQKEVQNAENQLNKSFSKETDIRTQKTQILKSLPIDASQYSLSYDTLKTILKEEKLSQGANLEEKEAEAQQLGVRKELKEYVAKLVEGEPCPLCGATHHPDVLHIQDIEYQLKEVKSNITQIKKIIAAIDTGLAHLSSLQTQQAQTEVEVLEKKAVLAAAKEKSDFHETSFIWAEFQGKNRAFVEAELEKMKQKQAEIAQKEKDRSALNDQKDKAEKELSRYQSRLEQLQKEEQELQVLVISGKKNLKIIDYAQYQIMQDERIYKEMKELESQYTQIKTHYENTNKQLQLLRGTIHKLTGEIEIFEKQQKEILQEIIQINLSLNEKLADSEFTNFRDVEAVLAMELNVASEKKLIEKFKQDFHTVNTQLADLQQQTQGELFDTTNFELLKKEIKRLEMQVEELTKEWGGLQKELKQMETDLEQKEVLESELVVLQNRGKDIQTLKNMFRSEGFVNYVSTVFLQNLSAAANNRFTKLTQNCLHLEITADNDFQVRDYLHDGQTRSVKTLSGGQTFQAALSLALGLADSVQKQAQAEQNFFFIDEGFGSQDKESLRVIFETLQSLRRENRIVGIISHVEELQQEIETYLKITNDVEKGSSIRGSWEE